MKKGREGSKKRKEREQKNPTKSKTKTGGAERQPVVCGGKQKGASCKSAATARSRDGHHVGRQGPPYEGEQLVQAGGEVL
jgi:hypothetical protein